MVSWQLLNSAIVVGKTAMDNISTNGFSGTGMGLAQWAIVCQLFRLMDYSDF